jgi:predicted RNase H-like nuclease (RuvC/YqgF family)
MPGTENQNIRIGEIRKKIGKLSKEHFQLKSENKSLSSENERLLGELAELNKKIEEIQNKDINLHLSRALEEDGAGKSADLRQRLDEYIREIDTVIAFLKD